MKRRKFLQLTSAGSLCATLGMPAVLRHASAQTTPIKIGIPTALSGALALLGEQTKRGADFFANEINGKGGVLGRPIELIYEDTTTNPATAVRKAQKLVEKDGVKFLAGVAASSENLAITPKTAEWDCLLIATIPGAGPLTSTEFNRRFFRVNMSSVMGSRVMSLYLKDNPMQRFFAIGSDYAYGRDSVESFTKLLATIGKESIGSSFPPLGTKDFASYIAQIKDSGAEACLVTLPGQDGTVFFKQAHQFGLTRDVKLLVESFETKFLDSTGEAMLGTFGAARYVYTIDNPRNKKFVSDYHAMYDVYPDYPDAMMYEALDWLCLSIQKAGTADDIEKVITAWEDTEYDGLRGPVFMRKCDHQAAQTGFVAEAVKDPNSSRVIPNILATYSAKQIIPKCRTSDYDD